MRPPARRAMALLHVIATLPLIAAVGAVALQVSNRALRVQSIETRLMADDAMMRDLVRRVQSDCARAKAAGLVPGSGGSEVRLTGPAGTVSYRASGGSVTRVGPVDGTTARWAWNMENVRVDFRLEAVSSLTGIVWMVFTVAVPQEVGRAAERQWSAAAAVGRGGVP